MAKKVFTKEDCAEHATEDDCWCVIHGKVYDVTDFLDEHPGGPEIITDVAGAVDASDSFEDTGHSEEARKDMQKYYIGDFDGPMPEPVKSKSSVGGSSGASPAMMAVAVLGLAGAVGFAYLQSQQQSQQ